MKAGSIVGFVAGLVAAAIVVLLVRQLDFFSNRPEIDTSRPSVVQRIQELQRLETVVFAIDKIVSGGYENKYLPRFLAGDRLLLIVYGDVTAGVDLSRLEPGNVKVDGKSVQLMLPAAELFSSRIVEKEVRKEAERQIRQAALDGGVLKTAMTNATATLKAFLHSLGFEQVEIHASE